MKTRSTTAIRILEASRMLFNEKGYAGTSVTEIAAALEQASSHSEIREIGNDRKFLDIARGPLLGDCLMPDPAEQRTF